MNMPATPLSDPSSPLSRAVAARPSSRSFMSGLMIPREHGAWGMVALPFIAATLVVGGWGKLTTLAAALGVFSTFLLRTPLQVLWRYWAAVRKSANQNQARNQRGAAAASRPDISDARFSSLLYGSVAMISGIYLFRRLPLMPLLLMTCGAVILTITILFLVSRNHQRHPALQIASAVGMSAAALPAYFAAHGRLDPIAFWIWLLCAVDSAASVLVVHSRLEAIVASRKTTPSPLPHRRNALLAQAGLGIFLVALAALGRPWLILPFVPTCALHCWDFKQLHSKTRTRVSMHRVGLMQLAASIAFCTLLIAVLRFSFL
jgi:hypothetical protein